MEKQIIERYNNGESMLSISKAFNITVYKIRKILIQAGQHIRDKSEAQLKGIENGHITPGMTGKSHSEESKNAIGQKTSKVWEKMDDEKRKNISDKHKERWNNMDVVSREKTIKTAHEGVRKAAKEGSKMEKLIVEWLSTKYKVIPHYKGALYNTKLEVDILLPVQNLAIEVDGRSHFDPIWNEKTLKRNQAADLTKDGLLMARGFKVLRIRNNIQSYSKVRLDEAQIIIMETVDNIIANKTKYTEITVS